MDDAQVQSAEVHHADRSGGRAWWENALLMGLVLSLFVHLMLALVAAWTSLRIVGRADVADDKSMLLASMDETTLTSLSAMPLPAAETAVRASAEEREVRIEELQLPPAEVADSLAVAGAVESLIGAGGGGAEGLGLEAAGGGAQFFGVEARGSRFAFVVDVSGSMMEPAKIGSLRSALLESVSRMLESASFCIVQFSTEATAMMGERWVRASEENKASAASAIARIEAAGGTNPMPGFEVVFRLKPRPDAVYFMTDGVFTREVDEQLPVFIEQYNRAGDRRVPIHCITFVDRGAEKTMRRIARQSGGTYTHVEAPRK